MFLNFLKKQKTIKAKKQTIKSLLLALNIPEKQKTLYLEALDIIDENGLEKLFVTLSEFTKEVEHNELKQIKKDNFSFVAGMKKKEAHEKQKEINSFQFLINNL